MTSAVEMMPNDGHEDGNERLDFVDLLPDPSMTLSFPTESCIKAAISLKDQVRDFLIHSSLFLLALKNAENIKVLRCTNSSCGFCIVACRLWKPHGIVKKGAERA